MERGMGRGDWRVGGRGELDGGGRYGGEVAAGREIQVGGNQRG